LQIECKTFWLAKHGNEADEYEDAFAPAVDVAVQDDVFRCAVADGATESSFAGAWARLLAEGYSHTSPIDELRSCLQFFVASKELSWFAEEKARSGAFAAIIGIEIRNDEKWDAEAVGDCCLFHVRAGKIVVTFPLAKREDFDKAPFLISSNHSAGEVPLLRMSSTWQSGDVFFLASDALARWMMIEAAEGIDVVQKVLALSDNSAFGELVQVERQNMDANDQARLRNDDTTLMLVKVTS